MIIEKVTVTDTPTSVKSLLETARPDLPEGHAIPDKCRTITVKYAATETAVVLLSDENTTTPITILDNVTEKIKFASIDDFSLTEALLSVASGTVVVDVIISEARV
jgi:hypothetical protein